MRINELEFTIDEEILDEASWIDPKIRKVLGGKGYKFLGTGVDQMAFMTPNGKAVLKIFGTSESTEHEPAKPKAGGDLPMSRHQKMFVIWANYCNKHASNPFLPKFGSDRQGRSYTPFVFNGRLYFQMFQELLQESNDASDVLEKYSETITRHPRDTLYSYIEGKTYPTSNWELDSVLEAKKLLPDKSKLKLMTDTLLELYAICKKRGWHWDLHSGNILSRSDGTPVLADPWHVGFNSY